MERTRARMPGRTLTEGWRVARRVLIVQSCPRVAGAIRASLALASVESVLLLDGHGVMNAIETWAPRRWSST